MTADCHATPYTWHADLLNERLIKVVRAPNAQVHHIHAGRHSIIEGVQKPGGVGDLHSKSPCCRLPSKASKAVQERELDAPGAGGWNYACDTMQRFPLVPTTAAQVLGQNGTGFSGLMSIMRSVAVP